MDEGLSASSSSAEAPGFDALLERLRAVVERLEGGKLSLEESLLAFEDGIRLSRSAAQILDAAEQRVEMLLAGERGETKRVAIPPAEPTD